MEAVSRRRFSPALLLEVLIVVLWLGSLAYAWQRTQNAPGASLSAGTELLSAVTEGPGAEWVGIYLQGQKIGAGISDVVRSKEGYRIQERTTLRLRAFEQDRELTTIFTASTDPQQVLKRFHFMLHSPPSAIDVKGEVRGTQLQLEIRSGGEVQKQELTLKSPPEIALTFKERVAALKPKVGQVLDLPYFDPASLSQQTLQVTVTQQGEALVDGVMTPTLTLETSYAGVKTSSIITADGRTLEETNALGMQLKRESRAQAMEQGWQKQTAVDVIALSAVPISEPIPNARATRRLYGRLKGGGVEVLLPRRDDGQKPGAFEVSIPDRETWKSYPIPMSDARFAPYLADSTALQVRHPRVVATAQSILGDVTDAQDAVARLNAWIHERLRKEPVMGVPGSLEILNTNKGDCNEHTTLFTALARAVGIPTRMAAGVVYSEQVTGSPAFYYHAWPEVYLGEWVPVDPTFGQFPADATHIKLVEGDLQDQLSLMRVVGNLSIEIHEVH